MAKSLDVVAGTIISNEPDRQFLPSGNLTSGRAHTSLSVS